MATSQDNIAWCIPFRDEAEQLLGINQGDRDRLVEEHLARSTDSLVEPSKHRPDENPEQTTEEAEPEKKNDDS